MLLILSLWIQAIWGYAPLYPQREPVDRIQDGVQQRSYLVIFNDKAPLFGLNKEKLQSWLKPTFGIEAEDVQHVYEITVNFRGCALWATSPILSSIQAHEAIQYVEEDSVVRVAAPFTARPDWGQVRVAQKGPRNLATIPSGLYNTSYPPAGNATEQWDWTADVYNGYKPINTGSGAFIWIVDTGILKTHQEFYRSATNTTSRVTRWQDYITTGGEGIDCNGHGSHCAGSAGGLYRGVAPGAELGSIRVLNCQGSGTNANVIAGFNYVTNNQVAGRTNILSASLIGGFSNASNQAITNGANAGVIPVVGAGNDNANACNYSPSSCPDAITVGAIDRTDAKASFSNTGSCVDVFTPGVSIHSAWYTGVTTYNTISGTSMATPLAAGSVALFATRQGTVRAPTVKDAIRQTGTTNLITGTLLPGTPNLIINANWS